MPPTNQNRQFEIDYALDVTRRTVADNVAGAGLEALVRHCIGSIQTPENISPDKPRQIPQNAVVEIMSPLL
jgi:hypothetical protein